MARPKTKRTSVRRKRKPAWNEPQTPAFVTILLGLLLGVALGVAALGLYQLFKSGSSEPRFRSVSMTVTRPPAATPYPAGWEQAETWSVPILMYHYIRPLPARDPMGQGLSVTPETFGQQLDYLIENGYTPITFAQLREGVLPPKPVILTFDDGLTDAYTAVFPALKQRGLVGTFYIVSGFVGNPGSVTWEQLREMQAAGMEIGAHSISHPDLEKSSLYDQREQINGSIDQISKRLGTPVTTFAYPAGKWTPAAVELLKQTGIVYGVTTAFGTATSTDDPELLPRFRINDATDLGTLLP